MVSSGKFFCKAQVQVVRAEEGKHKKSLRLFCVCLIYIDSVVKVTIYLMLRSDFYMNKFL